jgi:3-oxoacyl-[acyl-carrier protein] reductase
MIQGVIEGMKERRFGRIVNITSAMVKSPHAAMGLSTAARSGLTFEDARQAIANTINAKRFGQPEELGDACAYLCSAQAGFICGQNLQLDGGSYAGLI